MLMENRCLGREIILIQKDDGRYFVTLLEEKPLPGRIEDHPASCIRYKTKMHHTQGANTMEEAVAEARNLASKLIGFDEEHNLWVDKAYEALSPDKAFTAIMTCNDDGSVVRDSFDAKKVD